MEYNIEGLDLELLLYKLEHKVKHGVDTMTDDEVMALAAKYQELASCKTIISVYRTVRRAYRNNGVLHIVEKKSEQVLPSITALSLEAQAEVKSKIILAQQLDLPHEKVIGSMYAEYKGKSADECLAMLK